MDGKEDLVVEEFCKHAYQETGLPDEQKPRLLDYIFGKKYSHYLPKDMRIDKENIVRIEAERLEWYSNAKPKPLPAKALLLLEKAKQALVEKRYEKALELLLAEPVVFCGEALYHVGSCLESGEGLPASDTDFAQLYWASAVQASLPLSPANPWHLDVLSKLVQCEKPSWRTNPNSFPKCLSNGTSWFQNLWNELKSNQASSLPLETAKSVSNPSPPPSTLSAELNLETNRLVIEEEERRLWEALQSRPRELRGLGEPELAEAKNLLEKGPSEEGEKLAVELLRRKPAIWQAEALYLVARCVSAGRGVRNSTPEITFLYYTCALKFAGLGAKRSCFYLDSLWHSVEYLERPDAKVSFAKFKVSSDPDLHFKQLLGLMHGLNPQQRQQLLARSLQAPATSLLSKLAWREMWPSKGKFSIRAMRLSVCMQRFALSIREKPLIKMQSCKDEIRAFFSLAPTKHFWLDLRDVLARWWLARTDTHVAVRVVRPRQVLDGAPAQVEQTRVLKVQQLRRNCEQSGLELVPRKWALEHTKKVQNVFKIWEKECTEAVSDRELEDFLFPVKPKPGNSQVVVAQPSVQQAPDWDTIIRTCFEPQDGGYFVCWLAQQVRALLEPLLQESEMQAWICLEGQVPLLLRQILRSFFRSIGDEHVVVFRDVNEHILSQDKFNELQASRIVVLDGCSRRSNEERALTGLFRNLSAPTRKILGAGQMSMNVRNRSQILVLPDTNGQLLWTAEQLRAKGVAATAWRLAAPALAPKLLADVPCPEDFTRYLCTCMLENVVIAAPSSSTNRTGNSNNQTHTIETGDPFQRWVVELCRDVTEHRHLPSSKKPRETEYPLVVLIKQGPNKGRFVIRHFDILASYESFLGLSKDELDKQGQEVFWSRMKQIFPRVDLNKRFEFNILRSDGRCQKALLFPYTADEIREIGGIAALPTVDNETQHRRKQKKKRKRDKEKKAEQRKRKK